MKPYRTWRRPGVSGTLYSADVLEFLREQRPGSADLIFLDPPFNLGKAYSNKHPKLDRRSRQDYAKWLSSVLRGATRILADGGALFLYHIPEWAIQAAAELDRSLTFRHWIAVSMKNGFVRGERLYPAHYALLYFTKGDPGRFSRPRLAPQVCRHCSGLVKDYGGYTSIIEEKGVNLSDVWDDVSPVRHAANKYRQANELPRVITDRIVEIAGVPDGVFCDPFAGAGSSLLSAARARMKFRAADLLRENCAIIADRIDGLKAGRTGVHLNGGANG